MASVNTRQLCDAVWHWIAYKEACGLSKLVSEALLTLPITEFLVGQGWSVEPERDYLSIFQGDAKAGYLNFDIYAERGQERLVLEVKFLKAAKDSRSGAAVATERVVADIAKLAFPRDECTRLMVVGKSDLVMSAALMQRLKDGPHVEFVEKKAARIQGQAPINLTSTVITGMSNCPGGGLPDRCRIVCSGGAGAGRVSVLEVIRQDVC